MSKLYKPTDFTRQEVKLKESKLPKEEYRSEFWRDYARLLHCPSFRRLTGKTQLFPNNESDFFRNRLTHSLEVAQIAKSIARRLNFLYNIDIDLDLISFAALSHDLGHPPFGHQGEEALDECMKYEGGFEGNAQTLRIITKIEKKFYNREYPTGIEEKNGTDFRVGLQLTYRSIASILKYDNIIPNGEEERKKYHGDSDIKPIKGYYSTEHNLIENIKKTLVGNPSHKTFKTVECYIMDIADDIAYSNYDLEDSFKAGFLTPMDLLFPSDRLLERVVSKINERTKFNLNSDEVQEILFSIYGDFLNIEKVDALKNIPVDERKTKDYLFLNMGIAYKTSKLITKNGALRTQLTSHLVGKFIRGVEMDLNKKNPLLSKVFLNDALLKEVEILKTFTYESQILSPKLKIAELRGKEIVKKIFETIKDGNYHLMPKDYQQIYLNINEKYKNRIICDFIAGMTNKYAIEFYGRLTSENPETIFKPL